MRKLRKVIMTLFCVYFMLMLNVINSYAVSYDVSAKNNGNGKVTVTVSGKVVGGFNVTVGNASGQIAKQQLDQSASVTLTTGAGSFTVKVVGISISDAQYNVSENVVVTKSVTVTDKSSSHNSNSSSSSSQTTVPKEDTRSKENALSSLTVSEGTLSPKFNASTTKYTVAVEGDKTKITLTAKAKDSKAKVSGTGEKNLEVGKNTFVIKCTAENGSSRNYTIEVNVDEKPLIYTELNDKNLGVVRNLSGVEAPSGFEKTTTKINDQDVIAWTNEKMQLTICYLTDDENNKAFYVMNEGKPIYELKRVEIDGRYFIVIPLEDSLKEREGFTFQKVTLKELELDGWVYDDQAMKNYLQVYLLNEDGEKHFYEYETTEDQLQIYTETTKVEEFNVFIMTTIVFAMGCVGMIGYFIYSKKKISK